MHPPDEAVVFYREEEDLQHFLLGQAKSGLDDGDVVIYVAGTTSVGQVERLLTRSKLDLDFYRRHKRLAIISYDDLLLTDGTIDLQNAFAGLSQVTTQMQKNCKIQLLTESNWWLLTDAFESGMLLEQKHHLLPSNISAICSYNIKDLLEYVRIYHIAMLMERHRQTRLILHEHAEIRQEPKELLKNILISTIDDYGLSQTKDNVRTNSNLASPTGIIDSLIDQNDVADLEAIAEARLRWILEI